MMAKEMESIRRMQQKQKKEVEQMIDYEMKLQNIKKNQERKALLD